MKSEAQNPAMSRREGLHRSEPMSEEEVHFARLAVESREVLFEDAAAYMRQHRINRPQEGFGFYDGEKKGTFVFSDQGYSAQLHKHLLRPGADRKILAGAVSVDEIATLLVKRAGKLKFERKPVFIDGNPPHYTVLFAKPLTSKEKTQKATKDAALERQRALSSAAPLFVPVEAESKVD